MLGHTRQALRALRRSPWFFVTATGSIALGVGACTAVFAVVNAVFFRPLPFAAPGQLVEVYATNDPTLQAPADMLAGDRARLWPDWEFRTLDGLAIEGEQTFQIEMPGRGDDAVTTVGGAAVSGRWFQLLGVDAERGRTLGPDDDRPGAPEAVVVSHRLWTDYLEGNASALGTVIRLSGRSFTVVGVMPRAFESGNRLWVSRSSLPRGVSGGQALARLREGASLDQARLEVQQLAAGEVAADSIRYGGRGATIVPLGQLARRSARTNLRLMLGAAGAVFLLTVANLTSLFLVRAADQSAQQAIRAALGASRWKLGSTLLSEAAVVGVTGIGVGLLLAQWGRDVVIRSVSGAVPTSVPILDVRVMSFAIGLTLLAIAFVGLEPLRRLRGLQVQDALRGVTIAATLGPGERRLRSAMVGAQTAVALFLLTASGVIGTAVRAYRDVDVGFNADEVVIAEMDFLAAGIGPEEQRTLSAELQGAVAREPSISAVTRWQLYSRDFPPRPEQELSLDRAPDLPPGVSRPEENLFRVYGVGEGFFETLQIPILRGRALGPSDGPGDPSVAVVTEDAASAWWPGEEALGRQFRLGREAPWTTVVGVSRNVSELWNVGRFWTILPMKRVQVYLPYTQTASLPPGWNPGRGATFNQNVVVAARSDSGTEVAARVLETAISNRVPSARAISLRPMIDEQMASFGGSNLMLSQRVATGSAAVAILLALLGLAGVVGDSVSRRTREIGIRVALGAQARQVIAHVIRGGVGAAGAGALVGLVAYWTARTQLARAAFPGSLQRLDVSLMDWRIVLGASCALLGAALLTSFAVARRATRIDPISALTAD